MGKQVVLNNKSFIGHTHAIADVTGLQTALDAKASTEHNHTPGVWQDLPLSPSWANYGVDYGYATTGCRKLIGNLVEVKGTIRKSSALNNFELITFLPAGCRPNQIIHITTWGGAGTTQLQLASNGALVLLSCDSADVGLNFLFGAN